MYINQLRASGYQIVDAAIEGPKRWLRPIMMTMLVATLGPVPEAMSHAIGSDSQRLFAIVIAGGLITDLTLGIFLLAYPLRVVGATYRPAAENPGGDYRGCRRRLP